MRLPQRPPDFQRLIRELRDSGDRMEEVLGVSRESAGDGKYLHWDGLRHRKPPRGLTHREWWLALKLARSGFLKQIPLKDKAGKPFRFGLPDPAPEHLHAIDRDAGGRIEMAEQPITDPNTRDRYIARSLVEEAITSSQLEGAATVRLVAREMLRSGRLPKDNDERMIRNNYAAMQRVRQTGKGLLSPGLLLELHQILTDETLDNPDAVGRFRRPDENVDVSDMYNQGFHSPPNAKDLPGRIQAMCDFANEETPGFFIPPVVRSIVLHFWLAYDHPFVDGNGRTARAVFYWSMLRHGHRLCEFISISEIIKKGPTRYSMAFLHTETDDNDLTYFILYHLDIVREAIRELHRYIAKTTEETRRIERLIRRSTSLNHRQLALMSHAIRSPEAEYTIHSHKTSHRVVYQTARTDLLSLVRMGLLEERKVGRTFYFTPVSDLEQRLRGLA